MDANQDHLWAVVLAAGDGTRLRSLTTNKEGVAVPKQYCSFRGQTLLRSTLERARRIVPSHRIVVIVASQHQPWWSAELSDINPENIMVQPRNRGTAAGVLFPILHIFLRDRKAKVFVLPSDHYVEDEEILEETVRTALPFADGSLNRIVLLGMSPSSPDTGYGWMTLAPAQTNALHGVEAFVEKPPSSVAMSLMKQKALWNSFMFLAAASTLLRLYAMVLPALIKPFMLELGDSMSRWTHTRISYVYEVIPNYDFSRHFLEKILTHLWAVRVPDCGWGDLGTPERVMSCLDRTPSSLKYEKAFQLPDVRMTTQQTSSFVSRNYQQEAIQQEV